MGLSDHIVEVRDVKFMKNGLNLVPEVLSRESTLVAAGHVSSGFFQIPEKWWKGGAGKLKFVSNDLTY